MIELFPNLERIIFYFKYLCKHKLYVAKMCFKMGLYWRGIWHDIDKYRWNIFNHYSKNFYRIQECRKLKRWFDISEAQDNIFQFYVYGHIKKSKHHWQSWIVYDQGYLITLEMDEISIKEMLCDWWGASMAQGNGGWRGPKGVKEWYKENNPRMLLHPNTKKYIESFLSTIG